MGGGGDGGGGDGGGGHGDGDDGEVEGGAAASRGQVDLSFAFPPSSESSRQHSEVGPKQTLASFDAKWSPDGCGAEQANTPLSMPVIGDLVVSGRLYCSSLSELRKMAWQPSNASSLGKQAVVSPKQAVQVPCV